MIRSFRKIILLLCLIATCVPVFSSDSLGAVSISEGEKLFKMNCQACHNLKIRLVGPALEGVQNRRDEAWLMRWMRSSQSVVQSGDTTAVALFNTFNKVPMPDQKLTDDQIRSILAYIANGGAVQQPRDSIQPPPIAAAQSTMPPLKFSDFRFWILYTITVLLVVVSIYYKAEMVALRKQVEHTDDDA